MNVPLGHCTLDLAASEVRWPDRVETLTELEARLLAYLVGKAGQTVPRSEVLTEVWRYHPESRTHTVGVVVRRVRKKIEVVPAQPLILRTIRGQGWTLALPDGGSAHTATNLRLPRDRFFGRTAVLERLSNGRLITVVGPPGVGKSRLAREYARRCVEGGRYAEVWDVPVGAAESANGVCARIADALGIVLRQEGDWSGPVGKALAGRGAVLVLIDEAEAVVDVIGSLVDRWLDTAPHVRFLVTSRHRLKISGERVIVLEPLDPQDGAALFVDRASARAATDPNDDAIGPLVARLDGLPLALEFAAARIGLRSVSDLLRELGEQGSEPLEAAVRWTCGLLEPRERAALAQTSVFRGGFDLEAARAVIDLGPDHSAEGAIQALVDWSLLRRHPPARPDASVRFDSLAFIAEFARGLLTEPQQVVERHALFYARYGHDDFQRSLYQAGGMARRARVGEERGNLTRGARHGPADAATGCARALAMLLGLVGPLSEAVDVLEGVLAHPDLSLPNRFRSMLILSRALCRCGRVPEAVETLERAGELGYVENTPSWRNQHANVAFSLGRRTASQDPVALARTALTLAESSKDLKDISVAEMNLATAMMEAGDFGEAERLQHSALEHAREVGDEYGVAYAHVLIATWAHQREDDDALDRLIEARRLAEQVGDRYTVGWLTANIISGYTWRGRYEEGLEAAEFGIRVCRELGDTALEAVCKGNLATLLAKVDELEEACELLEQVLEAVRASQWPAAEAAYMCELAEVKARMGEDSTDLALRAIAILEHIGVAQELAKGWVQRGAVALWLDDPVTAQSALDKSLEIVDGQPSVGLQLAQKALRDRLEGEPS